MNFLKKNSHQTIGSYQSFKEQKKLVISKLGKEFIEYEGPIKNPIIVIPGLFGSHLANSITGKNAWGTFNGVDLVKGFSDKELKELALPMEYNRPLKYCKDNVSSTSLLNSFDINLLGFHIKKSAYDKLISILEEAGYTDSQKELPKDKNYHTLFTFYYDWRRDITENAILLSEFIEKKKMYIQAEYERFYKIKNYEIHFDIIAHSMGGLLARYYLNFDNAEMPQDGSILRPNWGGSNNIDKLIIIGTPNSGYLDTCFELVNGLQMAKHVPTYPPAVIGTFPSYYQMMPLSSTKSIFYDKDQNDILNIFDIDTWIRLKWGLANPNQDKYLKILLPELRSKDARRNTALDHLKKSLSRAKQFTETMGQHIDEWPDNITLLLFCGNTIETSSKASVDSSTGILGIVKYELGDGKVLSSSARMDEKIGPDGLPYSISPIKWDSVIHLNAAHMGITESPDFANNLIYNLLGTPPKKLIERNINIIKSDKK